MTSFQQDSSQPRLCHSNQDLSQSRSADQCQPQEPLQHSLDQLQSLLLPRPQPLFRPPTWQEQMVQLLAEGEFDGYLIHAVNKLRPKLPLPLPDFNDLLQQTRVWALEAIDMFVQADAEFTTFLFKHLNIRSMQWFNYCWMPCNQPSNRWVLAFSLLEGEDGSNFDPSKMVGKPDLSVTLVRCLKELRPYNKDLFSYFVEFIEYEEKWEKKPKLLQAFRMPPPATNVALVTGLQISRVEDFINDLERVGLNLAEML